MLKKGFLLFLLLGIVVLIFTVIVYKFNKNKAISGNLNNCSSPKTTEEYNYCHAPQLAKYNNPNKCLDKNANEDICAGTPNPKECVNTNEGIEICYQLTAEYLLDENLCEKVTSLDRKDLCYSAIAVLKTNTSLCDKAIFSSRDEKSYCYYRIATKVDDTKYCKNAGQYKNSCYIDVAEATKDKSICINVDPLALKNCIDAAEGKLIHIYQ